MHDLELVGGWWLYFLLLFLLGLLKCEDFLSQYFLEVFFMVFYALVVALDLLFLWLLYHLLLRHLLFSLHFYN